jgi:hypothetical protein
MLDGSTIHSSLTFGLDVHIAGVATTGLRSHDPRPSERNILKLVAPAGAR